MLKFWCLPFHQKKFKKPYIRFFEKKIRKSPLKISKSVVDLDVSGTKSLKVDITKTVWKPWDGECGDCQRKSHWLLMMTILKV